MQKLFEIFQEISSNGFVIYCGAGISIPAPSCSPSWWTLTEEILESFFSVAPDEWEVPKDLIIYDENKQPEAIFEAFANILEGKFYQIFESLNVTKPNGNHILIAQLAKVGLLKACITTNFDIFIEQALREAGIPFKLLVENTEYNSFNSEPDYNEFLLCKIHGTIEKPDSIVSVASAYKSNKGFSTPKAELIGHLLSQYPFLFLGYSGYDFNHLNYRRYWELMGPKIKNIYWNMRPNEKSNVPFKEIFETSWDKFKFVEGELPLDLIQSVSSVTSEVKTDDIPVVPIDQSNTYFTEAKQKRLEFFKSWATNLPLPHTLGLVMSQSSLFSSQFKDFMKSLKDLQSDKEATTLADNQYASNLASFGEKLGRQEITLEEFQKEQNRLSLRNSMKLIRKSWQDEIIKEIEDNKYPGVTDDVQARPMWLSYIVQLSQNFNLQESIKYATEFATDYKKVTQHYDKTAQVDLLLISYKSTMLHPNEQLWKPFYKEMLKIKEKFMRDELDYTGMSNELQRIIIEQGKVKMGMTVPLGPLEKRLIESIAQIESDDKFIEGLEVLLLSMDTVGAWLLGDLLQEKRFQEHFHKITGQKTKDEVFPVEELQAIDDELRKNYGPVVDRIKKMTNPDIAETLFELTILGKWKYLVHSIGGEFDTYAKYWDEGRYPLKAAHPLAYEFHKEHFTRWIEFGLENLSHRVIQKMVSYLIVIAESGNDVELIDYLTQKSLDLTNGLVTEASPQEVPGVLAAFLDLADKKEEALHYYEMALDALKTVSPPKNHEAILYRSIVLMNEYPDRYPKKDILKLIGRFHPNFYGNQLYALSGSPATGLALELANKVAFQEGYTNAKEAIDNLLE